MTSNTAEQEGFLSALEDLALKLQKTQTNFKKCSKARLTEGYIKARLECVEEYWTMFNKVHLDFTKRTPREQRGVLPYFLNEEYYKYEEVYLCVKADMLDLLNSGQSVKAKSIDCSASSNILDASLSTVRLPRIQLPSFSGKYEEFPTYEDLFTSLVHNNASLSNVQKLHYLKTSLMGEAEALLRHIQITDSNYTQAWNLLKSRYGNKRIIITSLLKRLFYQKKIFNQSSHNIKLLMDTTTECLNSLSNLGVSINSWDPMIVFLVVQKLDMQTHKEWEEHAYNEKTEELPKWSELQGFLQSKFRTLELITPTSSTRERSNYQKTFHISNKETKSLHMDNTSEPQLICTFCNGNHFIYHCKDFVKKSVKDRHDFALKTKLCFNCLVPNHSVFRCRQQTSCRICKKKHHSLLHLEKKQAESEVLTATITNEDTTDTHISAHYSRKDRSSLSILLATAQVNVILSTGETHVLRALIDQGSEASFVTERVVQLLRLKKKEVSGIVSGVGEKKLSFKHKVDLSIKSDTEHIKVKAFVMKTISSYLPARKVSIDWSQIQNLPLADPACCTPGKIDLLLGADVFARIIEEGLIRLQNGLVAQKTRFGWILSGQTTNHCKNELITSLFIREDNDLLRSFWEIEKELFTKKKILTKEEEECETIYSKTTIRDTDGKYVVHLPLKRSLEDTIKEVGRTKENAINRFIKLEKRFAKHKTFKEEYVKVLKEYIDMGHMRRLEEEENNENVIYLPHHAVIRHDKDTTKVRVVFDASAKGTNGVSLNDTMMSGPVLQRDLRSLITLWRTHKICVVGDIVKMYRMIKITEDHANLQCILWRDRPNEVISTYKLLTVTFGTTAAPFLAVRTLIQLANDEVKEYPEVSNALKNSFYMDDLMIGRDDIDSMKTLCTDIKRVLKKGGFEMQKWSSNSEEVLNFIQEEDNTRDKLEIKLDKIIKILGLTWDRKDDRFKITVNLPELVYPVTKRSILSDVARLFDPFGWLSPVVIRAKVMIQKLWLCNLGWDDELPEDLVGEWQNYREDLPDLRRIEVERWFHITPHNEEIQIYGFADASMTSYAAVTYLRVVDKEDVVHVTMIASRTKVAPLRQLTIPKLELCAAALLAELLEEVSELLQVQENKIYAYTDSMVVLSWLQSPPNRWRTFVANRVAGILRVINNSRWNHITSAENPADLATRGVKASDLKDMELWWSGPGWLKRKDVEQPIKKIIPQTDLEMKCLFSTNSKVEETPIWERFSSVSRMKRVLSYCRRFLKVKDKEYGREYVTVEEMETILLSCIRYYQNLSYEREIHDIKREGKVRKGSSLVTLSPFLDKNGIIRVGGRLKHADIPDTQKYPIVIPPKVHIAKLIINEAHIKTLHGGIQLMMVYIRSRYWMTNLKSAVRKRIRTCKICIIDKARVKTQKMGDLPAVRVNPHRAFLNTGVDYAGPIHMRTTKGRGHHSTKGYICLFVCMATRAIHLEAVSDLTSQAFIAAFRRFVARRGQCAHLWSDNGTNFVGAARELKELFQKGQPNVMQEVAGLIANEGTKWHFIPPRMPNYGGLWEAGVQSAKRHLLRVNGTTKLTYEEMSTLLAQIEACLNSRPLCLLDDTTETLIPLTPGHFLIGEPLVAVPDRYYENINVNLINRWQMLQKITQHFWRRWKSEYLNTMQQRYKWQDTINAPRIGEIVVIKEDDLPPTKWLLGRIKALHPGSDNLVRVVTVQCKGSNELKRPLSRLIILPTDSNH